MASLSTETMVFGVEELMIVPLLTDVAEEAPTYGTPIRLTGAKNFSCGKKTTNKQSRGDEMLLANTYILDGYDISFENAVVDLKALAAINNGTVVQQTTPNNENILIETANSIGSYFKVIVKPNHNKYSAADIKDMAIVFFKVNGELSMDLKGDDYATCSFKGTALPVFGSITGPDTTERANVTKYIYQSSTTIDIATL